MENQIEKTEEIIQKEGGALGFLKGLHGRTKPNIAALYESQASALLTEEIDAQIDEPDEYKTNGESFVITFIELAIINEYLHNVYCKPSEKIIVTNYGSIDSIGRISFGGTFNITDAWWFQVKFADDDNEYIFQTKMYMDNRKDIITELQIFYPLQ